MRPLLVLAAALSLPTVAEAKTLKEIVNGTIVPIGDLVVSLLYALAFIFFLIGIARFFFADGQEARDKGRAFALWSLIGFFVLFAVWGLVNVLLGILKEFAA